MIIIEYQMIMKDEGGIYIMTRSELASHIDATQVQSNVTEKDLDYLIRQSVELSLIHI